MEIADLLSPDAVLSHLKAASKKQVLQEMAHKAASLTRLLERRMRGMGLWPFGTK